ncbi:myosin light chain kinase 2, skeletal/cardiac muscle [Sceloporus undulatus]|uniref:myosin light chain kinase 2, skeletal/cardiac muscle n=1 Tax=Sceloporus undulatus TaxID=8520 RepID=UPI001C4C5BB8|nr:myosin light chain kinase 2, skeletal/cardiac muscle [Sceloporus undulatus]XP_042321088.1 myosin light chain kinase 2, skeletal/cardiac muscle [Sceloporus undulatus]
MEKDGDACSAHDSREGGGGGGGEPTAPAVDPTELKEEVKTNPEEPSQTETGGGEGPDEAKAAEENQSHTEGSQQKPLHLQQSFSCPPTIQSLGDIPEEVLDAQGEQKPEELIVSSHEGGGGGGEPVTGESKDVEAPALPQEPAGEQLSPAEKEAERTLAEPPSMAPESTSAETSATIPTEEPHPVEQLPSENKADVATPAEVGAPPVPESPTGPFLTPDFGKEDPATILDDTPPPPAPFTHRIVKLRTGEFKDTYSINTKEMLGGGKFGEVRVCTVKETGLKLAVKTIKTQGPKDKEMVELEIDVMNQLNHRNLIQLYDAIEMPKTIMLFMEFVEGGELFERIIDEDYPLTEVDCMVFVRQICDGILFMHQMRVLHLDLKPENILCVSATGHMVKIIDFGLARRYNPREKLKVNFGTPEFLSPEVVSYEQVSYTTDMWSMGVITYMLLSGLSPFLGDNDTETLNNVLAANWYFDEEAFEGISEEAKDFVSNLIIKDKSGRMNAAQCLQHPWLNNLAEKAGRVNRRLKSQVLLRKYVMRRRWKKNFIGVCAANRFKKITSSGSLTALGV